MIDVRAFRENCQATGTKAPLFEPIGRDDSLVTAPIRDLSDLFVACNKCIVCQLPPWAPILLYALGYEAIFHETVQDTPDNVIVSLFGRVSWFAENSGAATEFCPADTFAILLRGV